MDVRTFRLPSSVVSGPGAADRVGDLAESLGVSRALLVTDAGIEATGAVDAVESRLTVVGIETARFSGVTAEPPLSVVDQAVEVARQRDCDGVVAVGGGSSIDTAKGVAAVASRDGGIRSLVGEGALDHRGLPTIMLPTTSGTGSEVTGIAIFTDEDTQLKVAVASPHLIPSVAIVDPNLTLSAPESVTAVSGIDAMSHAIEAFTSRNASPQTDALAKEAMARIGANLRLAVASGSDRPPRNEMALGSLMAGMAFANAGVSAAHALAYPLGARFHLTHGVCIAILLPHVMRANRTASPGKYAEVARIIGGREDLGDEAAAASRAADLVAELVSDCGVPSRLTEVGADAGAIHDMAEAAAKIDRLLRNNPRRLEAEEIEEIYRAAL